MFMVEVDFEDSIYDDNEINEVAKNVLNGVVQQVNQEGLAPEGSETFTKRVSVHFNDETIDEVKF